MGLDRLPVVHNQRQVSQRAVAARLHFLQVLVTMVGGCLAEQSRQHADERKLVLAKRDVLAAADRQ